MFICLPVRTFQVSNIPQDRFKPEKLFLLPPPHSVKNAAKTLQLLLRRGNERMLMI